VKDGSECLELSGLISAYVDGELGESDIKRAEEHLKTCGSCSALLDFYREISASTLESCSDAPDALRERVMDKVLNEDVPVRADYEKRRKVIRMVLTRYLPVAACLALVLLALPRVIDLNRSANDMARNESPLVMTSGSSGGGAESYPVDMDDSATSNAITTDGMVGGATPMMPPATSGDPRIGGDPSTEPDTAPGGGFTGSPAPSLAPSPSAMPPDISYPEETPQEDVETQLGLNGNVTPGYGDNGEGGIPVMPYYAVIEISGDLPGFLGDYISVLVDDVTQHFLIPCDAVQGLVDELAGRDDVVFSSMDMIGEFALVIYRRDG